MKVYYCSDLHNEFGTCNESLGEGELLLLAGDVLTEPLVQRRAHLLDRFVESLRRFDRVLYIPGNHEPYDDSVENTYDVIQDWLVKNAKHVEFLPKSTSVEINGITFLCTALWTDFNGADPYIMRQAGKRMNDYRMITCHGRPLDPADVLNWHREAIEFLKIELAKPGPKIVMSHHAPHERGLNRNHSGRDLDYCYYSDLTDLIEGAVDLRYWVHGHTHVVTEYKIGNTTVLSNQRGYIGHEDLAYRFGARFFEVES